MTETQSPPRGRFIERIDRVAMLLSGLCAVHCVVTPILIAVAPLVASHEFEESMRGLLGGLAIVGVGLGTLLHRNARAIPFLIFGLGLLIYLQLYGAHDGRELTISLVASGLLVTAHVLNSLACRRESHQAAH